MSTHEQFSISDLAKQFTHFTEADSAGWSTLFNLDEEAELIKAIDQVKIFLPFGAREELIKHGLVEVQGQ